MKTRFTIALLLTSLCAGSNAIAQTTLKDVFKDCFLVGAALNEAQFSGHDKQAASIVIQQFNSITPENVLKWEHVHPEPNRYDFAPADKFVEFGEKNGMFIVGHTLVWHNQTPKWVFSAEGGEDENGKQVTKERLLYLMRLHIYSVMGRYKGRIKGWDVVNEALADDGSYQPSPWLKIIGEEYLVKAYQYAHEADPDAALYYNDFSVENTPKRNGVIKLVKMLQSQGIQIAGIGMQGHYLMNWPTVGQLDSTIKEFAALGVKVMITELDLDILPQPDPQESAEVSRKFEYDKKLNPYTDGLPEAKQQELATRYAELFRVFVKNGDNIARVTFWGVDDGSSWLNNWPIRGRTSYPLLFGRDGRPKPAFDAVVRTATQGPE
jgi:endo-1,4-beta-xylanase